MTTAVDVVDEVRRAIPQDWISRRCSKSGCSVSLEDAPSPRVLIDMDRPKVPSGQNGKKCDYIFIGGSVAVWVAPMELKRGKPNASQVVLQLQAGADVADKIIPRNAEIQFRPIVVFGGGMSGVETRLFAKDSSRIRFRNQQREIKLHQSRNPLALAFRQ